LKLKYKPTAPYEFLTRLGLIFESLNRWRVSDFPKEGESMSNLKKVIQNYVYEYYLNGIPYWRVCVPDGRGGQVRRQGFIDRKEAEDFAVKSFAQSLHKNKGLVASDNFTKFSDYSLEWLETSLRRGQFGESTKVNYANQIKIWLIPYFGQMKLGSIEKKHVRSFIHQLVQDHVSSKTINYSLRVFKSIIKQAETDDFIPYTGISQIKALKTKIEEPKFWDSNQMQTFLEAIKSYDDYDLWIFALYTGLRACEIAGLKWDCVSFKKIDNSILGSIKVRRIWCQKTRKIQEHTKTRENRELPMTPQVYEVVYNRYTKRKGDFVFGDNTPLDSSHFCRKLDVVLKKINNESLPRITFHQMRHSFCSYLEATGMPRRIVMELMGHKDSKTTNRYSHVNQRMTEEAVSKWYVENSKQNSNKVTAKENEITNNIHYLHAN
jgi:integrase